MISLATPALNQQAVAQGNCNSAQGSRFDGYIARNGYQGASYRGVIGRIVTRVGFSCDGDPRPEFNFTLANYLLSSPPFHNICAPETRGYSQAGYFRGDGGPIHGFAETNQFGCGPLRRFFPPQFSNLQVGSDHEYKQEYYPWSGVIASSIDGQVVLYTDFHAGTSWGILSTWEAQVFAETKYIESDVPGSFGASGFFHAMGSKTDTFGWLGDIEFNFGVNDVPSRWALGQLNEFNPSVYGLNFQVFTY